MLYITHLLYVAKTFPVTKVKDGFFHRKKNIFYRDCIVRHKIQKDTIRDTIKKLNKQAER